LGIAHNNLTKCLATGEEIIVKTKAIYTRGGSTVVEHLIHHPKVQGLSPPTTTGAGRD